MTVARQPLGPASLRRPDNQATSRPVGLIESLAARCAVTILLLGIAATVAIARGVRARWPFVVRKSEAGKPKCVLLVGTFYNVGWYRSHVLPLVRCSAVGRVIVACDEPLFAVEKVKYASPCSATLKRWGRGVARVWTLLGAIRRESPDVLMGYHIMPNGLLCLALAALFGKRAIYQMTGGPVQIEGGGAGSENVLLRKLRKPSRMREALMFHLVRRFDTVIVRGRQALRFVRERVGAKSVRIVPGSVDCDRFSPDDSPKRFDFVCCGRLVPVKRYDRVLQIAAAMAKRRPGLRVAILGDGPLESELREQTKSLGLGEIVAFLGRRDDVVPTLRESRLFLIASENEGLSIAMMEAMATGLPVLAPRVGDLGEVLLDGTTGLFIDADDAERVAEAADSLLGDTARLTQLSRQAREHVVSYASIERVARSWDEEFAGAVQAGRTPSPAAPPRVFSRKRLWESTPRFVKRAAEPLIRLVPPERWLGGKFRETLRFVHESDRWSAERIVEHQLEQLRRICTIAYEKTRFYREVFDDCGFDPRQLRSASELQMLPLIDKETLREHGERMYAVEPGSPNVEMTSTGGTGGSPLRFLIGTDRSAIEYAYLVASWQRAGYELTHAQAVIRGQVVEPDSSGLRHEYDPLLRRHYYSNFHMTDESMARYLDHVAGIGPCYLHVYPSSAATLARFIERTGRAAPPNIRGTLAGSENVYPAERALAERVIPGRYLSWYGHTEKLVLAGECERSADYHVFPTYGYCELIGEDGRPVSSAGQTGEIVGTGFINAAMPFIRYRTGDFATFVGNGCEACGRRHVLIRDIRGHRTHEMLIAHDGSMISWTAINMHDETFEGVRQFQFVQEKPGWATLRVVPAEGFSNENVARIRRGLGAKLAERLTFDVQLVDEIPLTPRGKSVYVDQRIELGARSELRVASGELRIESRP
ncbi:MAG: glycosyltransferase [Phycisphaerae bacterium]